MIRRNKGDFISYGILHRFDTEFAHIQYIPTYKVYIFQKSRFTFCVQVFGTQPNSLQLLLLLVLFFFLEFSNEFVSVVKERNNFTEPRMNVLIRVGRIHQYWFKTSQQHLLFVTYISVIPITVLSVLTLSSDWSSSESRRRWRPRWRYFQQGGPVKLDSMWQHRLTRLVRDRYMYSIRITV